MKNGKRENRRDEEGARGTGRKRDRGKKRESRKITKVKGSK